MPPGGAPFQSSFAPPAGSTSGSHSQQQQQQQHSVHQSHNGMADRGSLYDSHHSQSARPSSQATQPGPSLSRPPYGGNGAPTPSNSIQHQSVAPSQHNHASMSGPPHSQGHAHSHAHPSHPQGGYGVPMHVRDYEQQPPPPGSRAVNQHHQLVPPPLGRQQQQQAFQRWCSRQGAGGRWRLTSRDSKERGGRSKTRRGEAIGGRGHKGCGRQGQCCGDKCGKRRANSGKQEDSKAQGSRRSHPSSSLGYD